jgi:periodic tryptophan protein 2
MGSALDFVFGNLISGRYDGSSIAFIPNTSQLLLPQGNRLTIFDVARGTSETHELEHPATITTVTVSDCGRYFVTADRQNYVYISESRTGGFSYRRRFKKAITALAFAPGGEVGFAVASSNKLALYRHPSQISELKPFVADKRVGGHFEAIQAITFSKDGAFFSTCSNDLTIRIFKTEPTEGFVPVTLAGHRGRPLFAVFAGSAPTLTSLGADGSLFVWRMQDDYSVVVVSKRRLDEEDFDKPKNRFQNITAAAYNGDVLVAGFADGFFKTYPIANDRANVFASATVTFSTERVRSVALSGKYAALTSEKLGELVVWDLDSGNVVQRTQSHFGGVACFDYSPNGVVVATGGDDGKLKVWDTQTGACLVTFQDHKGPISDVRFGESGRTVITASYDGTCKAFDVVGARCFRTFSPQDPAEFAALAIDSQTEFVAATARLSLSIFLWSVQTGQLLESLSGHTAPVSCLAFTGNGKLVSGSWDGTVRVWDFLDAHSSIGLECRGEVTALAVSADRDTLCIATSSGRLILYASESGDFIGEIECSADARGGKLLESERSSATTQWYFETLSFSPDGKFVICGGRTRYICIYAIESRLLVSRFSHTSNTEYSGVDGYVKKYHGSGIAEQVLLAKLGRREVIQAASRVVRWCPTGRGAAAATPEGLLVFVSNRDRIVDPVDLAASVTPDAVAKAVDAGEWVEAVGMALRLGRTETESVLTVIGKIPIAAVDFVCAHVPAKLASRLLEALAEGARTRRTVELFVKWMLGVLRFHGHHIAREGPATAHLAQKVVSSRIEVVRSAARRNLDLMNFLCAQPDPED